MKFVLVVVILCFSINLISAFSWFNARSNQQVKQVTTSVNTDHLTSHRQQTTVRQQSHSKNAVSAHHQSLTASNKTSVNHSPLQRALTQRGQYYSRNTTIIHRQADINLKRSSPAISQNRFNGIAYRQNNQSRTHPGIVRQSDQVANKTNNRVFNPRFRSFAQTGKINNTVALSGSHRTFSRTSLVRSALADSKVNTPSINKNTARSFSPRSRLTKGVTKNTKTSLLHRTLTTKVTGMNDSQTQRHLPANSNYQQRLRAFHNAGLSRSTVNAPLKQRKRRNEQNIVRSDSFNPMIYARDPPSKEKNINPHQ